MRATADLRRRILNRTARVAVVGQGYVGLSLACAAAEAGFRVTGLDVDARRVAALRDGTDGVAGVAEDVFARRVRDRRLDVHHVGGAVAESQLVFICVPTPVRDAAPDLSFVETRCVGTWPPTCDAGPLVVLESTTYPGTTEELVRPLLETSGLRAGRDFLLAYSPERIDPGNDEFGFREVPRIVGGMTPEATGLATLFYEQLVDKVMPVSRAGPPSSRSCSRTRSAT